MTHYNPNITENQFCILAMRSEKGNFTEGFSVIGPFNSEDQAVAWAKENIVNRKYDNPHWVVTTMTNVVADQLPFINDLLTDLWVRVPEEYKTYVSNIGSHIESMIAGTWKSPYENDDASIDNGLINQE